MQHLRIGLLALAFPVLAQALGAPASPWVASWATSPQVAEPDPEEPLLKLQDQTVRERVRLALGGTRIRLRFSNEYGTGPLRLGAVSVALPTDPASVRADTIQAATFGGRASAVIPAGATLLSDPVALAVPAGAEISVSLYLPERVATPTIHALALKRAVISRPGDHTRDVTITGGALSESSLSLVTVLVPAASSQRLLVAFGDSLVDGDGSSLDADRNWPADLARRLRQTPGAGQVGVINAGIAGNRLLSGGFGPSALARLERDVLTVPGVTHLIVSEGLNDIGFPGAKLGGQFLAQPGETRTLADLTGAYRQIIRQAHSHGIKVIGATLSPCEGVSIPGYQSEAKDVLRQAVNAWIRTSGAFDAVLDFEAILRDPERPARIRPNLAYQDHLHPNDAGYQALADAIDLGLLR